MSRYEGYATDDKLLTPDEEQELGRRSMKGDLMARDMLVVRNLRLVLHIVKKMHRNYSGHLTFDDCVSDGIIGLMEGAERFDPDKGAKFSSYASWWIKQAVRKKMTEEEIPMRVPVAIGQFRKRLRVEMEAFKDEFGFYPVADEIEELFPRISKRGVKALMEISSVFSLDMPVTEGESDNMGDLVSDRKAISPSMVVELLEREGEIERLLDCLNDREKLIIVHRFGLLGNPPMTLEGVSEMVGRTRERVRQIQNVALKKMRKMLD